MIWRLPDGSPKMDLLIAFVCLGVGWGLFFIAHRAVVKSPADSRLRGGAFEQLVALTVTGCYGIGLVSLFQYMIVTGWAAAAGAVGAAIVALITLRLLRRRIAAATPGGPSAPAV